jgi:polysaccharide pyruvyl transferase WcaK-like protein
VNGVRPVRVFLLTPYTGGNLGDHAIQQSFIATLAPKCRDAEFMGITLDPRATAALHGIPCFPLSVQVAQRQGGASLHPPHPVSPDLEAVPLITPVDHATDDVSLSPARPVRNVVARASLFPWARASVRAVRRRLGVLRRIPGELAFSMRAARLLGKDDLLVVAGGGQLDEDWGGPWSHPFALWRWTALAKLRGCRIAIASVGWGNLVSATGRRLAAGALGRADYLSFRDAGSAAQAASLGIIDSGNVVPDIALALPLPAGLVQVANRGLSRIGVSPIAFAREGNWRVANSAVYSRYLTELAEFVSGLTARGLRVLIYTTGQMDRAVVAELVARVLKAPLTRSELVEVADTSTVSRLLNALAMCDLIVASRLHGVILAHRLALPTLAISFDRKVTAHMSDVGQAHLCFDIHHFDSEGLLAALEDLAAHAAEVSDELRDFLCQAQGPLAQQFDRLADLACPRS